MLPEESAGLPETTSATRCLAYVGRRLDRVEQHLMQTQRRCTDEALHELRVEIKTLRAALRPLFQLDAGGQLRAGWDPVRRAFQAAGPLRDMHVQRQLLGELSPDSGLAMEEWHNILMWRETRARRRYLAEIGRLDSDWRQGLETAVSCIVALLSPPELEWRIQERLSVTVSLLADTGDEQDLGQVDLHRVRKRSKEARYTLGVLENVSEEREPKWQTLDRALHDVHRALGGWHDALVTQEDLEKFLTQEALLPLRHPDAYRAHLEQLSRRLDARLATFHEAWQVLLHALQPGRILSRERRGPGTAVASHE